MTSFVSVTSSKIVPRALTRSLSVVIVQVKAGSRRIALRAEALAPVRARQKKDERRKVFEATLVADGENTDRLQVRDSASASRADGRQSDGGNLGALPDNVDAKGELDGRVEGCRKFRTCKEEPERKTAHVHYGSKARVSMGDEKRKNARRTHSVATP